MTTSKLAETVVAQGALDRVLLHARALAALQLDDGPIRYLQYMSQELAALTSAIREYDKLLAYIEQTDEE